MEYPNAKITANISPQTQICRIIIPEQVLPNENPDGNAKFIRAGKFIEDYETGDAAKIGKWFNLPTTSSLIKEFMEFDNLGSNVSKKNLTIINNEVVIRPEGRKLT